MSDEERDDETSYGLLMPFVTVVSKGGPHEDESYAAGWEMGVLDARLEFEKPAVLDRRSTGAAVRPTSSPGQGQRSPAARSARSVATLLILGSVPPRTAGHPNPTPTPCAASRCHGAC